MYIKAEGPFVPFGGWGESNHLTALLMGRDRTLGLLSLWLDVLWYGLLDSTEKESTVYSTGGDAQLVIHAPLAGFEHHILLSFAPIPLGIAKKDSCNPPGRR